MEEEYGKIDHLMKIEDGIIARSALYVRGIDVFFSHKIKRAMCQTGRIPWFLQNRAP